MLKYSKSKTKVLSMDKKDVISKEILKSRKNNYKLNLKSKSLNLEKHFKTCYN